MSYLDKHTFIMTWKTWFEFHIAVFSRVLYKSVQHRVYQPLACNSSFNPSPIPSGKVPHVHSCLDPFTSSANSHALANPLAEKCADGAPCFLWGRPDLGKRPFGQKLQRDGLWAPWNVPLASWIPNPVL